MKKMKTALLAFALAMAAPFAAAQAWPSKPVRIIVPFPAGGSGDISVRHVADRLATALGQPVLVENRVGAAGHIGGEVAAKSPPDGYTLLLASDAFGVAPHLYAKLPYDPIKDFVPIIQLGRQPILLAVHPGTGVNNLAELAAAAKSKPGMGYATSGAGTQQHIVGELYTRLGGAPLTHVPYKGGGQAVTDVVGGQVPVAILGSGPLMQHHKSGRVKVLAQSTGTRSAALPEVPTFAEAGVQGVVVEQWLGIVAPTGTPDAIVQRLNLEINRILADPGLRERYAQAALDTVGGTPAQFAARIKDDYDKYGVVIKQYGIKLE